MDQKWTRGDKFAAAGIILGVLGVFAAVVVVPEVRRVAGLDDPPIPQGAAETPRTTGDTQLRSEKGSQAATATDVSEHVAASTSDTRAREEARIASESPDFSPMTMQAYLDAWYDRSATDLQQDALQKRMLNKRVIWQGLVTSVEPHGENEIRVVVEPRPNTSRTVFLDFDILQRDDLLVLRPGDEIRFTCVIEGYVASPFLGQCKLLARIQ